MFFFRLSGPTCFWNHIGHRDQPRKWKSQGRFTSCRMPGWKDPYVSVRRKVKFQAVTAVWMLGMPRKLLEVIWMLNLDLLKKNIYIYIMIFIHRNRKIDKQTNKHTHTHVYIYTCIHIYICRCIFRNQSLPRSWTNKKSHLQDIEFYGPRWRVPWNS